MHDERTVVRFFGFWWSYKTVNGKGSCTTATSITANIRNMMKSYKTVNGKGSCTTIDKVISGVQGYRVTKP